MKTIFKIFKLLIIRPSEWLASAPLMAYFTFLNYLLVSKYADVFMHTQKTTTFFDHFRLSGFDSLIYSTLTQWHLAFFVHRHPLLADMLWPLTMLNDGLYALTGLNLAQVIVAVILLLMTLYSFVFIRRTMRQVVGLGRMDANLLTYLTFSFAYVTLTYIVPDHFAPSMTLLTLTMYLAGKKMQKGKTFTKFQTVVLFLLTAGVTMSNGVKTFIMKRRAQSAAELRAYVKAVADTTTTLYDSASIYQEAKRRYQRHLWEVHERNMKDPWNANKGKPISKTGFGAWTDISTPRWESTVENMLGEGFLLHRDYLLEDCLRTRPAIVPYRSWFGYVHEVLLLLLFAAGVWYGRRSRFLWMLLSCMAFDLVLHLGLGFGLNEVYIMTAHWAFVIPVAIGFLLHHVKGLHHFSLHILIALLTLWLWIWNGWLITQYMTH